MSKKEHPWNKGRPKIVGRNSTKARGNVEDMYTHRIEPHEPVTPRCDDQKPPHQKDKEPDQ